MQMIIAAAHNNLHSNNNRPYLGMWWNELVCTVVHVVRVINIIKIKNIYTKHMQLSNCALVIIFFLWQHVRHMTINIVEEV